MANKYTIGLDVGTSGSKAVLYDLDGNPRYSFYTDYSLIATSIGMAELDAIDVWGKIQALIRQLTDNVPASDITAICVSSLGEALVPVTRDRKIIGNSILNIDTRGQEYIQVINREINSELFCQIAGDQLSNVYSITKLMWIKNHAPDVYQKAFKFLPWNGLVPFLLGGEDCVDYSQASRTLMFDQTNNTWSELILATAGIDASKLPAVFQTGAIVGTVNSQMSKSLGLSTRTKIVLGPHDQVANAVGCGISKRGQAMISMGSFFCVVPLFVPRPPADQICRHRINTEPYVLKDSYVSVIYNQGGLLFKWYRDTFDLFADQIMSRLDRYDLLEKEVPIEPSEILVLPSFSPIGSPHHIQKPNGVITGLSLTSRRGDILKGIFQGVVFYLFDRIRKLSELGVNTNYYYAVGGGSKSDVWVQIISDVFGAEVHRPDVIESATLGDSIIAWVASNEYSSYDEAIHKIVKIERKFIPNKKNLQIYGELFLKYLDLWNKTFPG